MSKPATSKHNFNPLAITTPLSNGKSGWITARDNSQQKDEGTATPSLPSSASKTFRSSLISTQGRNAQKRPRKTREERLNQSASAQSLNIEIKNGLKKSIVNDTQPDN